MLENNCVYNLHISAEAVTIYKTESFTTRLLHYDKSLSFK